MVETLYANYDLDNIIIVSGCAKGADTEALMVAFHHSLPVEKFPADWKKYGKGAGYKRNEEMAEYADALLAFWDGKSKGTKHMIDIAKKKGLRVDIVRYNVPS